MKLIASVFLGVALGAAASRGDLTIIQEVEQHAPPEEGTMTVVMKFKGDKMRVNVGADVSTIVDLRSGNTTSLMHEQRIVMNVPAPDASSSSEAMTLAPEAPAEVPKPTGRAQMLSGYTCREFQTKSDGMTIRLWLTDDLPNAEKLMTEVAELARKDDPIHKMIQSAKVAGFPIRTEIEQFGRGMTVVTVVAVNENSIPDSEFSAPSDYRAIETPALLQE